jgi:Ca2+-transporting ATPase
MIDPPRNEAKSSFSMHTSRNHPVMITGDHELTAKAIAKQLGIITSQEDVILSGTKRVIRKEFSDIVEHMCVFMPVSTLNKIKNKSTASKRPVCSDDR